MKARPAGFTALLARDGCEALALWEKGRPDLLCLDIMMPHLDGYEVCRLRKRIEPYAAAPTIIETVRGAGYRFRPRGV